MLLGERRRSVALQVADALHRRVMCALAASRVAWPLIECLAAYSKIAMQASTRAEILPGAKRLEGLHVSADGSRLQKPKHLREMAGLVC